MSDVTDKRLAQLADCYVAQAKQSQWCLDVALALRELQRNRALVDAALREDLGGEE